MIASASVPAGRSKRELVGVRAPAGAAEDVVVAVGTLVGADEREEVRAVADQVVLAEAAEEHVVAAAALDVVVAVGHALDRGRQDQRAERVARAGEPRGAGERVLERAVAEQHVVAELAEDHVVARAAGDVVVAERRDLARRDRRARERRRVEEVEHGVRHAGAPLEADLVAEDQVRAAVAVDRVARRAADQDVVAGAALEPVAAAVVEVAGAHVLQAVGERARVAVDQRAVVAEDEVGAAAGHDRVVAGAAEQDVVAVAGADPVAAAEGRGERRDRAEDLRQRREREVVERAVARPHGAVVAEHDVGALAGVDRVGAGAAEEQVVAAERGDRVVAADPGVDRLGEHEAAGDAVGAVAEAAGAELLRAVEVGDAAAVAEDDVAARAAEDRVVALAAEDHQRQRRALAVDHVVVGGQRLLRGAEALHRRGDDGQDRERAVGAGERDRVIDKHRCRGRRRRCR